VFPSTSTSPVENNNKNKFSSPGIINKKLAYEMQKEFDTPEKVETALLTLKEYWESLLSVFSIKTSENKLDRMVNIWNQYQNMVTFNFSRSASYFESGIGRGLGFRDSNQDLTGFVHLVPEKARERIIDIASTQFEDGSAYHQYQPLTKKGNADIGGNFNDDPLWLILSVSFYIKETGDWAILEEQVPFNNDESKAKSLFEHLKRSFYHVVNNLGDSADYSEWKNKRRATGLVYSAGTFAMKFGGGVAGAVIGFVLSSYGYDGMDASTIPASIPGIKLLMSWIPTIFITLAIIVMFFYPLTKAKMEKIESDLMSFRNKSGN